MKLLIATGIYPPDIGGPATILKALADSLIGLGISVKIITYSEKTEVVKDNEIKIYKINKKRFFLRRYFRYLYRFSKLAKWADLVYVTDTYSVGYFAYLLKKFLNIKYIVRFAGDSAWEMSVANGWTNDYIVDFQKKIYSKKIEKLKNRRKKILLNANKVIAVSNFLADIAEAIGVAKDKIEVIYNSIDFLEDPINLVRKTENIKFKYGRNAKIIVTACRLTPWKGVAGIIKILPELKNRIGNVNLLVLGDGQELENLKSSAFNSGVKDEVIFLGKIKHQDIISYFKAADLFILNTNYEGLSHTILEAMKSEVPIITTNIGGNPEVITDGKEGMLINYDDQKGMFDSAVKILSDKQFSESLTNQAKEKLKVFNWKDGMEKTLELLKKVSNE